MIMLCRKCRHRFDKYCMRYKKPLLRTRGCNYVP